MRKIPWILIGLANRFGLPADFKRIAARHLPVMDGGSATAWTASDVLEIGCIGN